MKGNRGKFGRRLLAIGFWILVWQLGALYVDNHIILVGPWDTVLALGRLIPDGDFWRSVAYSFGKISLGVFVCFRGWGGFGRTGVQAGGCERSAGTDYGAFEIHSRGVFRDLGSDLGRVGESVGAYRVYCGPAYDLC